LRYTDIAIFALGHFILPHPVQLRISYTCYTVDARTWLLNTHVREAVTYGKTCFPYTLNKRNGTVMGKSKQRFDVMITESHVVTTRTFDLKARDLFGFLFKSITI